MANSSVAMAAPEGFGHRYLCPAACLAFWNYPEVQVSRARGEGCCRQSKAVVPLGGFAAHLWGSRRGKQGTPYLSLPDLCCPLRARSGHKFRWLPNTAAHCLLLRRERPCVPSSLWHRVADCCSPGAAPLPSASLPAWAWPAASELII